MTVAYRLMNGNFCNERYNGTTRYVGARVRVAPSELHEKWHYKFITNCAIH